MSAADNLGNLFVALLAGIPLLIFALFACCACLEASIQAARRSYKPHLPTRVRFADEAQEEEEDSSSSRRQSRNPLLFGLRSGSRSGGPGHIEGSGLVAHSSYIQKYPNYRYSTVGQSPLGRSTPPPVLKNTRTEFGGSGSLKSPVSPLSESQRLLERGGILRGTPTRGTPPKVGSPASYTIVPQHCSTPPSLKKQPCSSTALPGKPILRQTNSFLLSSAATVSIASAEDTDSRDLISEKSSPTLTVSNALLYFDGRSRGSNSRRSSASTPAITPATSSVAEEEAEGTTSSVPYSARSKSPFQHCDSEQQMRRYSTPISPTMYSYHYEQRPQNSSNYSSMSYLPEVRTYLNLMEEETSNRQRSRSFSGRPSRHSPRPHPYHLPSPARSPSPFTLELSALDSGDQEEASKLSTPSSFETTFLTPPGSTDQGSFKSPESGTPDWLLSSDVPPPPRYFSVTAIQDPEDSTGVNYKPALSRSCSIRTATI